MINGSYFWSRFWARAYTFFRQIGMLFSAESWDTLLAYFVYFTIHCDRSLGDLWAVARSAAGTKWYTVSRKFSSFNFRAIASNISRLSLNTFWRLLWFKPGTFGVRNIHSVNWAIYIVYRFCWVEWFLLFFDFRKWAHCYRLSVFLWAHF